MRKLSHIIAIAAVATGAFMSLVAAPALAAPPVAESGAYVGAASETSLMAFGTWRGAPMTVASDYLADSSWSSIEDPDWWLSAWQPFTSTGGQLVLGVPLLTTAGGSFAAGAAGSYDTYFKGLAESLVAAGDGDAILRLGWEFNGSWYPWSLSSTNSADSPAEFIAYWQHVVTLMRSVAGSDFKFDWNVNNGPEAIPATEAYPGNAYVDYIGVDTYDEGYASNGGPITSDSARWTQITTESYGLDYWASFAKQQGKPITIPEWGEDTDTNGGGDDPYYIQQMYTWLQQNQAAFESYYDYEGALTAGSTPNAAAEYQALWGDANTSSGSSTTTTGSGTPGGSGSGTTTSGGSTTKTTSGGSTTKTTSGGSKTKSSPTKQKSHAHSSHESRKSKKPKKAKKDKSKKAKKDKSKKDEKSKRSKSKRNEKARRTKAR